MKRFTAAALQFSPVPMDIDANMKKAEAMIAECVGKCGAELIVLPESFTTGFTPVGPREKLWEAVSPMPGTLTEVGAKWAKKYNSYIIFPSYEKGPDGVIWNSAALLGPREGYMGAYRKTHPFPTERITGNDGWTTPGSEPFCVETDLGKIGIVICYDGDFPELVRVTALMGAEVVVRPSAFFRTFDHWELTNRARAYDNHVYMVASNIAGYDASGGYCFGSSMIVNPTGVKLAQARGTEEYVWAELDPEPLKTIYPNSSAKMEFDHIEDRNVGVYKTILHEGKSAFEPARRIPYNRPDSAAGENHAGSTPRKPLEGLVVLDMTRVLAGPFAGMMLADMGADVIKVENPDGGDDSRAFTPFQNGQSAYFMSLNRSKRGVTLNLKNEKGKELFKKLAAKADVVLENYKPGTMKKLGLNYEVLRELNPRLIYAASSGFGQYGPYSSRPAYDLIVQGMGGLMSITGFDKEHPLKVGSSMADLLAGIFSVIGILAAVENRHTTGRGQMVDVAMLDCLVATLENAIARYITSGKSPEPIGNDHPSICPFATIQSRDGFVNIAAGNNVLWGRLCNVIGMERYIEDTRFDTNANRIYNWPALKELLTEHMAKKTTAEWLEELMAVQVPCGPINNIEQIVNDPQIAAREMIVEVDNPLGGPLKMPGVPIKFSETPAAISCPAPVLGQHNEEIYCGWIGLGKKELEELRAEGAV